MKTQYLAVALSSSLMFACGSGEVDETTEIISAEQGATLTIAGASIEIPANAVAEDTEVTVTVASLADYEPLADARETVIVFDPLVVLESGAAIVIDAGEPALSSGDVAYLQQFIDGTWIAVDASTVVDEDGKVHSSIWLLAPTVVVVPTPDQS